MSQNDGLDPHKKTVNCDKSTDYALQYFENIPEWKNPVKVPPREMPWICPEREENQCWNKLSFAAKYVNYEMSPRFIDLDDPFVVQKCNEIRKGQDIFQTIQPKNVPVKKDMNEMDDFLDEYGNIKEKGDSIQSPWKDLDSEQKIIDKAISHAAEPRKSYLNVEEQKNYLPLYIQFWEKRHSVNQSNCLDRRNYSLFSHYIETVRNEQIEFSNFVKNVWYETDHVKKLVVRDDVRKFVDDYFENQIKDILGKLPHFYNNTNKFIRCSPSNPLEEFDLVLENSLLILGAQSKRNSDTTHSGGENDNDDIFGDTDHTLTESFGENLSQLDGNDDELDNQHNNSNSNPSINAESKKPANEVNPSQKDTLDLGSILESQKNAHKCTEDVKKPSLRITSQFLFDAQSMVSDLQGKKKNNKFPEVMTISTKLDNQWNYGAEVATKSERAKDWMSNFIRPGSINCRLRVQTKDPNLDLNSRLNLEEYKIDKPLSSKGIPWIPLDFSIVTSWHKKNNRVPGLFEPDSNFKSPSINRKRKRGGGGRGRGRGIKTAQLKN
ncbi:unnamed protein product [Lepeophtheirus salmonis]|uniref:(salmon louse) hypothetical protein n=1 Tax=Lepeophtheirus salmonis TaxID=72036 RepID=A0A7R8CDL2_LEPSM|nr:unnamed protein product [Lepeophtheirus salmonis]CAF2781966.1 unnamed protein product [Lepeophtheirus salmonis]